MKINLYEELKRLPVLPLKYSTANQILSGNKLAALTLRVEYNKFKSGSGYFLSKDSQSKSSQSIEEQQKQVDSRLMGEFDLNKFIFPSIIPLIEAEAEAAEEEEEETEMVELLQWSR